jgi:hypothetical protein
MSGTDDRSAPRPTRSEVAVERTYVRFRGCMPFAVVIAGVVVAAVLAVAGLEPDLAEHYAGWVWNRVSSFFFPLVVELERVPEPSVYLKDTGGERCGKDHTASLKALRAIFEGGGDVPPDESRKSIFANLVRLNRHGVDYCTGLQVTTDGFVVTANHCLERYEPAWIANMRGKPLGEGMVGPVAELRDVRIVGTYREIGHLDESFLATYPEYDLALVKADVPEREHEPVHFNLETRDPRAGESITLAAFNSGKMFIYDGTVIAPTLGGAYIDNEGLKGLGPRVVEDGFFTDVYCEGGFSGGVVLDAQGALVGVHSWGVDLGSNNLASGHAKAKHVETLIRRSYDELYGASASECAGEGWEGL